MATFNGHPSKTLWNVAMWISSDERFYFAAKRCMKESKTKDEAAGMLLDYLQDAGWMGTPDGYPFTTSNLRYALRGLT